MMVRLGYPAFVVPDRFGTPAIIQVFSHIFSLDSEIKKIIHAADLDQAKSTITFTASYHARNFPFIVLLRFSS